MKILKFNLDDAPEDATDFYYNLLHAAKDAGFDLPEFMLRRNHELWIEREELFEAIVHTFGEIYFRGGPNYMLSRYGPLCMMTDQEPSPAQKKKSLRIKKRRDREEKKP